VDCTLSCPAGAGETTRPPKKSFNDWKISFTYGMYFIMGIVFIVGSIIIILLTFLAYRQEKRYEIGNGH
jgi:uncharacterized membrane protein